MLTLNQIYCGYLPNKPIVQDINLEIKSGEVCCIIGPNGSGKSTLLKALSNILDYDGNIILNGINLKDLSRKQLSRKIAFLSQSIESYFSYTVYDTVILGRYPYINGVFATPSNKDYKIVNEALKLVGIYDIKNKLINEISGGQLQRVFLARTIAQQPKVILLDEPTNHLDFKHQIEIIDYIKDWAKKENKIVVAVLHDLNLVQKYADKVMLLNNGKSVCIGNTKEILSSKIIKDVYDIDVKSWMLDVLKSWES